MSMTAEAGAVQQYLTFHMAGEEYAIGILQVREITQFDALTRVPSAPAWVRGVINLRGNVVPVVDLSVKFGLGAGEITRWTCLVIVEVILRGEPLVMGLMADAVSQVMELSDEDIEPPPAFGTRARGEQLTGLARMGSKFALILDIDGVLDEDEVAVLAAAEAQGREPDDAAGEEA